MSSLARPPNSQVDTHESPRKDALLGVVYTYRLRTTCKRDSGRNKTLIRASAEPS